MTKPEWYQKAKGSRSNGGIIPLEASNCDKNSVYMLQGDGTLWTLDSSFKEPHKQVREGIFWDDYLPLNGFVCTKCGAYEHTFDEMEAAHVFGSSVGVRLEIA